MQDGGVHTSTEVKTDSTLAQIEELVEHYLPFMYESFYVFVADAINRARVVEPEFRFEPEKMDWRSYWLDVHMPGRRRWAFPLIEGKRPEKYRAAHPVRLGKGGSRASERVPGRGPSHVSARRRAAGE